MQRTVRIVDADRCTLYLVDNVGKGLFAMQGEVNIRISLDQGIAGAVATNGILNNIPDAYEDTRFNQVDEILCWDKQIKFLLSLNLLYLPSLARLLTRSQDIARRQYFVFLLRKKMVS